MGFATPALPELDALADTASRYVDPATIEWQEMGLPGVEIKVLLADDSGVRTALVRMAPGAEIPFHEHTGLEQTYMLEGRLEDHEGACTPHTYVWRPAGSQHVARAPEGALMIAMFESPNIFLDGERSGETLKQMAAAE